MIAIMDKKKKANDKIERIPMALNAKWHEVAAKMAADQKMPLVWLIIDLIHKKAVEEGIADLPALPWESKGTK